MEKSKIAVTLLCGTLLLSGCSLFKNDNGYKNLPPNPSSFGQIYDEDSGETTININGRTYSYFGRINERMNSDSIKECLGYVDKDKDYRIYTLSEDPSDNYIMLKHIAS